MQYRWNHGNHWALSLALALGAWSGISGCGDRRSDKKVVQQATGKIDAEFLKAAQDYRIPYRLLLAVAFKESGMSPRSVSASYPGDSGAKSLEVGGSAFGLPLQTLGLVNGPENESFAPQVHGYARWLRDNLSEQKIELSPNAQTPTEIYDWVWFVAKLHRSGHEAKRNVQVVFARELLQQLNNGARWQDAESGEVLELSPEAKALEIDDFPAEVRNNLQLYTDETEIFHAQFVELSFDPPADRSNNPTHVRVIHCPFSLSACLEMQKASTDATAVQLGAHYVIPGQEGVVPKALQINQHKTSVSLTNAQGQAELVQDAIVIMLTGSSGRYIEGRRHAANPKWLGKNQLITLGKIVRAICPIMKRANDAVNLEKCTLAGAGGTVQFELLDGDSYQWGDIPDYDETIFRTYVNEPQALSGDASFTFANPKRVFPAGPVSFGVNFIRGAAKVEVEFLERCPSGKLIWTPRAMDYVFNSNSQTFSISLLNEGPNQNGQHFFRALVYDQTNTLMGWAVEDVMLTGYDADFGVPPSAKSCERLGG